MDFLFKLFDSLGHQGRWSVQLCFNLVMIVLLATLYFRMNHLLTTTLIALTLQGQATENKLNRHLETADRPQYGRVGIRIGRHLPHRVSKVWDKSPASEAGLKVGDIVTQPTDIDDIDGPSGEWVTLVVKRGKEEKELWFHIKRVPPKIFINNWRDRD